MEWFEKEIVVDGFVGGGCGERVGGVKVGVEEGNVREGNVGEGEVEIIVEGCLDFVKRGGGDFVVGIEMGEDCRGEEMVVERDEMGIGGVGEDGMEEEGERWGGLEDRGGGEGVMWEEVGDGVGYVFGGVERGEEGGFEGMEKGVVVCLVVGVVRDKGVEVEGGGEELEVGFGGGEGMGELVWRVEDRFERGERGVGLKYGRVLGCGCDILGVKDEWGGYGVDVVGEFVFGVKGDIGVSKGGLVG